LLKELFNLKENYEILRRMCSTDEEKFLGSMTTIIYNRTNEMSHELSKTLTNVRNWFATMDKKQQQISDKYLSEQEEMKKILLFDINRIAKTMDDVQSMVVTQEDRKIGNEVIATADKVDEIFHRLPELDDKVSNISSRLDRISSEVLHMRWYVIVAAVISIIVLIISFFN